MRVLIEARVCRARFKIPLLPEISEALNHLVVLGVRTYPEPHNFIIFRPNSDRAIVEPDSHRPDWPSLMNRLEMQAVMKRILQELSVRVVGESLDSLRETSIADPEIACGSGGQALQLGDLGKIEHFSAPFRVLPQCLISELLEFVR